MTIQDARSEMPLMTSLERALVWLRDAAIVGALVVAPLVWGKWGTVEASAGLAIIFCLMALGWLAFLAASLLARRDLAFLRTPLNLPVALLLAIALISTAFASVNRCRSALAFYQMLAGAMAFWLIANQPATTGRRRLYLGALIAATVAVSWLGTREYVLQNVIGRNPSWRIFATFLNPNELAGFLGLVIPLAAAAFLWSRSPAARILIGFAVILTLLALLLTGSRGGWLSLAAGIFVFGLLAGVAFRRTRLAVAAGVGALALILLVALAVPPLRARVLGSLSGQQHSNMFRYLTWQGTETMAADHPWLGVGPGAFEFAYPRYAKGGFTRMAHQNYLQTAAEMGIPGAIAFVWMLGAFFWLAGKAFRRLRDREGRLLGAGCIAGVLVFCVHSFFDYGWYIGAIEFTVFALFGLVASAAAPAPPEPAPAPTPQSAHRPQPGAKRRRRAPEPPPAEQPALLAVRRWQLNLSPAAAWIALAVAAGGGALISAPPVRAYLADGQNQQGRRAQAQGNLLMAETCFRAAVRLMPGCGEYHRDLARVIGPPKGIAELERAIELEPTNPINQVMLAKTYEIVGPWDEAAARYQRAIELYPNYLRAYRGLADLDVRRGRVESALTLYRRMVAIERSPYERYKALEQRIEPEYAYAHYELGRAALERGDAETAHTELERALEILRQRETIGATMIQALQAAGEYSPATEREISELRARSLWRLAQVWQRLGDEPKADPLRVQARQAAPDVERLVEQEPPLAAKGGKTDAQSRSGAS